MFVGRRRVIVRLNAINATQTGDRFSSVSDVTRLGVLGNGAVATAALLHALAVDTGGTAGGKAALARLLATVVIYVFEIEGVDVAGEDAEERVVLANI